MNQDSLSNQDLKYCNMIIPKIEKEKNIINMLTD